MCLGGSVEVCGGVLTIHMTNYLKETWEKPIKLPLKEVHDLNLHFLYSYCKY